MPPPFRAWILACLLLAPAGWVVAQSTGGSAAGPPTADADWPVYGLDPAETNYSP